MSKGSLILDSRPKSNHSPAFMKTTASKEMKKTIMMTGLKMNLRMEILMGRLLKKVMMRYDYGIREGLGIDWQDDCITLGGT